MTTAELNLTATYVTALASEPNATEKIKMLLQSLFASYGKGGDFPAQETEKSTSRRVAFEGRTVAETLTSMELPDLIASFRVPERKDIYLGKS